MSQKRFWKSMAVVALVFGVISLGPAWAQGTAASINQSTETITLKVDGWTCRSCEKDIRRALLVVPGVKAADVSYARGGAVVSVELGRVTHDQLIKAVESASTLLSSYHATVVPNGTLSEASAGTGGVSDVLKGLFQ